MIVHRDLRRAPCVRAVIDWVGGMPDIEQRVVRTIGDPIVRFREDPVRILRAIRFSAKLDLAIAEEVYDAIVVCRDSLARTARPRRRGLEAGVMPSLPAPGTFRLYPFAEPPVPAGEYVLTGDVSADQSRGTYRSVRVASARKCAKRRTSRLVLSIGYIHSENHLGT